MSGYSRTVHGWVRHERDRALRDTGALHRYLNDALFHAAVDLIMRTVETTGEVLAEQTDDPRLVEEVLRASVRRIIDDHTTVEDHRWLTQQVIELPPRRPDVQAFVDLPFTAPRGGVRFPEQA